MFTNRLPAFIHSFLLKEAEEVSDKVTAPSTEKYMELQHPINKIAQILYSDPS